MADTVEKAPSDYATSTSFSHDLVVTSDSSTVTTAKESINTIILGNSGENKPPVVDAGADKTVTVNQSVTLIGTATDSDGRIVSYEWKKGSEVLGTEATLVYTPTIVGTDTLTLTVTDDYGESHHDDINIIVISNEAFFMLGDSIIRKNIDNTSHSTQLVTPFWNSMMFATVNHGLKTFSADSSFKCESNKINEYVSDLTWLGSYSGTTYLLIAEGSGKLSVYSFTESSKYYNWSLVSTLINGTYFRVETLENTGESTIVALDDNGYVLVYYNAIKNIYNNGSGTSFTNGAYHFIDNFSKTGDIEDKYGKSIAFVGRGHQLVTLKIPDYDPDITGGSNAPWFGNKVITLNETNVDGNIVKLFSIQDTLYVLQKEGELLVFDTSTDIPNLKQTIDLNEFKSERVTEWTSLTTLNTEVGRTLLVTGFNKSLIAFNINDLNNLKHVKLFGTDNLCWNIIGVSTSRYKPPLYISCTTEVIRVDLSLTNQLQDNQVTTIYDSCDTGGSIETNINNGQHAEEPVGTIDNFADKK
jgi:hypothetical protein